jgi:hypothetical protein
MNLKKKNTKYILFSLFILCANFNINAQEAEIKFHKEFSKLSLVYNFASLKGSNAQNNDGSTYPILKFKNSSSSQFGFYYNFAQSGNFNFKTGVIAKEVYPVFDILVSSDDIGLGFKSTDLLTDFNPANSFAFSIPIKTEYFIKVNKDIALVLGAGLNMNLFTGGGEPVGLTVSVENETQSKNILRATTEQDQITFSTDFSIGLNYNFKYAMVQMDFFYSSFMFDSPQSGTYTIKNLEASPDKSGTFLVTGAFTGVGFSLTPKKGWQHFGKKKIKK